MAPSATPLYRVWQAMKARCYQRRCGVYEYYGGRGIVVCDRWRTSFATFAADMGPRPAGATIDRIDNDGPYAPENCRWATKIEQMNNTRRNTHVTVAGETMTVAEAARKTGVNPWTIHRIVNTGQSLDDYLKSRSRPSKPLATHCKRGHPFTPENTVMRALGRTCRICKLETTRQWQRAHRGGSSIPIPAHD